MKVAVNVPLVPGQSLAIDLDDQLPADVPRGGTWSFLNPADRHRLQAAHGFLLLPNGGVRYNVGDAYPSHPAPGNARLTYLPDSAIAGVPTEYDYEPGEPGLELPNGQVFQSFGQLQSSSYWLNNYRSQPMVIEARPGTYYNVLGSFHWSNGVQRLTIKAKDPAKRPRFIKRQKLAGGQEIGGHVLAVRNDCLTYPDALITLQGLILEGGMSNMDPGSAAILGMYGNHAKVRLLDCEFVRGNCGPTNYPDRRPDTKAGSVDDLGYYHSDYEVTRCTFIDVGNSSNHSSATHGLYITHSKRLLVQNCRFLATDVRSPALNYDAPGGHMAKVGAWYTSLLDNVFDNRLGAYTTAIEFPYGGNLLVRGNLCMSGDNTTGAGGPGGAQIQAMNEWAAHGITRRNTVIRIERNTQLHRGAKIMRSWAFRLKDIPGVGLTTAHMQLEHVENVTHGPGMSLPGNNINL